MAQKGKIMAHTDKLLNLIGDFPEAFDNPEGTGQSGEQSAHDSSEEQTTTNTEDSAIPSTDTDPLGAPISTSEQASTPAAWDSITAQLNTLEQPTQEPTSDFSGTHVSGLNQTSTTVQGEPTFEEMIADPVAPLAQNSPASEVHPAQNLAANGQVDAATPGEEIAPAQPIDYTQALQRRLSTFTWGEIEVYLTYGASGLQSVWITVGKSGTEVQSLCEAIARLANLLLAKQVPVAEIAQQLRGIRGADAEGLGPNRILGLADLIGKVVQEAPNTLAEQGKQTRPTPNEPPGQPPVTGPPSEPNMQPNELVWDSASATWVPQNPKTTGEENSTAGGPPQQAVWTSLPQESGHTAGLCPACGAELQIMNGCTGGACMVCGYSSCS